MVKDKTPQAVESCHKLLLWMIPHLDKFPRNRRFTLGERLENSLIEVLELLITASYSRNKSSSLERANQQLAVVRHIWRLAWELKAVAGNSYEYGSKLLYELGNQIGGWRKYAQNRRNMA